jgi:hypothetical protein
MIRTKVNADEIGIKRAAGDEPLLEGAAADFAMPH